MRNGDDFMRNGMIGKMYHESENIDGRSGVFAANKDNRKRHCCKFVQYNF